jgi:hypothetical protein
MTTDLTIPPQPRDIVLAQRAVGPVVVVSGELQTSVTALIDRLGALPVITDQVSYDALRKVGREAGALMKLVNAQRANAKQPWIDVAAAIDDAARPITAALQSVIDEVKGQGQEFLAEQDRLRIAAAEAARIAQATADAAMAAQPGNAPALTVTVLPQEIVAPTQKRTEVEVLDKALIPMEFWDLNMARLRQAVITEGREVPGARKVENTYVVNR